ncbi:hypothetical protein K0A97_00655 [Patescibacteria group bacterium]|nr:hypothetical protein [Patescibacteria group bacterium]
MGFIKGALLSLTTFLLFITILLSIVFFTMSFSLKYENFEDEFILVVENLTDGKFNLVDENFDLKKDLSPFLEPMILYCENLEENLSSYTNTSNLSGDLSQNLSLGMFENSSENSSENNPTVYVFSTGGYIFSFPCNILDNGEGEENLTDRIKNKAVSDISQQVYYADYGCGFWDCFKGAGISFFRKGTEGWRGTLFLVSEKARNYWNEKFYSLLTFILILLAATFVFTKQKINTLSIPGLILISSSFILLWAKKKLEGVTISYLMFVNVFLNKTPIVFKLTLLLGISFLILWLFLLIWRSELSKRKFSKREVMEILKTELSKMNPKNHFKKNKKVLGNSENSKNSENLNANLDSNKNQEESFKSKDKTKDNNPKPKDNKK